jgi:hypothetical protein
VLGELPNGAGNSSEWTPSTAGANYLMVDDIQTSPVETTEVSSSDVDTVDLYQFSQADLDLAPTTTPPDVHGIMVDVEASMKNSGTANLRVEVRDGSNQETDGTDLPFTGSAKVSRPTVLVENPTGTPAPWTIASLNTIELGLRYSS